MGRPQDQPTGPLASSSRRRFFAHVGDGIHGAALAFLLGGDLFHRSGLLAGDQPVDPHSPPHQPLDLRPRNPHFLPRATSVIHLCMQGGPSQVDTFDPKPELERHAGGPIPAELTKRAIQLRTSTLMPSPWKFHRHGACGTPVSELMPHVARHVDDLAIIRSMYNVHPNHEPAIYKLQSGLTFPGHPCFGSWIAYGLGSENRSLPAYIVLADPLSRLPVNGVENWQSGYLPPLFQGTRFRSTGSPVLNLRREYTEPAAVTAVKEDLLARLDRIHQTRRHGRAELDARINNYELAARMQLEATDTLDTSSESEKTLGMYGIGQKQTDSFGRRCLLARRLVERGVRFVQLYPRGQLWDNHRDIRKSLSSACQQTDLPVAGLLEDLKQRGLLESTLVIWGGEFGRLPLVQGASGSQLTTAGRDHGPYGFTTWMAGGGVKGGTIHGSTDDFGFAAVENRVSIEDWHATILHLLGMDHEELFFDRNGLKERLTHTFGARIVREILA